MPLRLKFPGGVLTVWEEKNHFYLSGSVTKIFTGTLGSSILFILD